MVKLNKVIVPGEESSFPKSRIVRIKNLNNERFIWIFIIDGAGQLPQRRKLSELDEEVKNLLANLVDWSPPTVQYAEADLTEFQISSRDSAVRIIKELKAESAELSDIFEDSLRGKLAKKIAKKLAIDRKTVYEALFRWWRNGMTDGALIPTIGLSNQGKTAKEGQGRRGPKVEGVSEHCLTDEIKGLVVSTIKKSAKKGHGKDGIFKNVELAVGSTMLDQAGRKKYVPAPPERAVTREQFEYIYEKLNRDRSLERRLEGQIKFDLGHSISLNTAHDRLMGPAHEYQIDETGSQVEVVDVAGNPIGTAFIILVIDTWSNLIVGFHADLGVTTDDAISLAFFNAISEKTAFCRYYGVEISSEQWPVEGVPIGYLGDNGSGYTSNRTNSYVISLPTNLSSTRAHHGPGKGDIEGNIKFLKTSLLRYIRGFRAKSGQERGAGNPKKKAALTIHELRSLIIRWILKRNRKPMARRAVPVIAQEHGVTPTSIELWKWGMQNLTEPLQGISKEELWVRLLPQREVRITGKGIVYGGLTYTNLDYENDRVFQIAKNAPRTMQARIDDSRPDMIFIHEPGSNKLIPCSRINLSSSMQTWTFADAKAMEDNHKAKAKAAEKGYRVEDVQVQLDINEANDLAERRRRAQGAGSTAKESVGNNRKLEQMRLAEEDQQASRDGYKNAPPKRRKVTPKPPPSNDRIDSEIDSILSESLE